MTNMRRKFKPAVVIGVGGYSSEIAKAIYDTVTKKCQGDVSKVTCCLTLDEDGEFRDVKENKSLFKCEGLKIDLSPGTFSANFETIRSQEKVFEDILSSRIEGVRKMEALIELQNKGYEIDNKVNLIFISTLFDSVGSAAIIPFLGFVQSLLTGRLRGIEVENDLLAFFPDLFEEYKVNELAYARSYTCMQELDFVAEHPQLISLEGKSPFRFIWLFTGKNEDGIEIGSFKNLIPMISETLFSLLTGEIASDISFSTVLLDKVDGKTARWSSFGLTKLVFPKDEVMEAFSHYLGFKILETARITVPLIFDREYISADVKEFLLLNRFDKLSLESEIDREGQTIWLDFKYRGRINEELSADGFIKDIEEDAGDFDRNEVTAMNRKLALKREHLFKDKAESLVSAIYAGIDLKEKGVYYSKALLDVLQNQQSPYTKGEAIDNGYTLDLIERKTKSFFDKAFGIDRGKLTSLKQDIDGKKRLLERLKQEMSKKEGQKEGQKEELPETELEEKGLREGVEALEAEIGALQAVYNESFASISTFDIKIADPSERRKLLGIIEEKIGNEIEETKTKLVGTDEKYREEKFKLDELYQKRKRIAAQFFMIVPCVGTIALLAVLFLISQIFDLSFLRVFGAGTRLYPIGILGYGIWALSKYWKGIRREIQEAERRFDSLKNDKIKFFLRLQELYNRIFKTRFEHSIHGGLLGWTKDFKGFVSELSRELQSFIEGLVQFMLDSKERWEKFDLLNTLFTRSVITKEDLNRFIQENMRLPIEINRFFEDKPISVYFDHLRRNSTLDSLVTAIAAYSQEVFKPVREKHIEEFLEDEERKGRISVGEKLSYLFDSAKALILLDVERGMDVSQPLSYLGVENPETSFVKDIFRKKGFPQVQTFSVGSKNEVVIVKLKVGFPAFHIALMKYGERLLSNINDRKSLYINPEWELQDLSPSIYMLGDAEDPARRIVCLAKAFELIKEKENKLYFIDQEIGMSYQETIDFVRSFRGSSVRSKLEDQIEKEKRKEGAVNRLITYQEKEDALDSVDKKIIETVINELNPLA